MQAAPKRRIGWLVFTVFFLAMTVVGLWQRYNILDQIRLYHYQPPAAVTTLADETTMLSGSRRVFFANHPLLEDKAEFAGNCTSGEKTIVLGCYKTGKGIYIYDVTDTRLHGVVEVTAAHEMLHAEYERLSPFEKKKIDTMLTNAYAKVTDKRVRDTIQLYQDAGADVTNELHSILGTEVRNLPTDLENYYKRYFKDRAVIVTFLEQYQQEFSSRSQQVTADDAQLKTMKDRINQQTDQLSQEIAQLNAEYRRLQGLRASGDIQSYNAGVDGYTRAATAYNAKVRTLQQLVTDYNNLVVARNSIAFEEQQLSQAMDSRLSTAQAQ